jgi:hypothetical protein
MVVTKKPAAKPAAKITLQNGNEEHIKHIQQLLAKLAEQDVYNNDADGFSDKIAIQRIFKMTESRSKDDLLLRLTVIDSMYSTQMNRRYYALQELAEKLDCLNKKTDLPTLFNTFINSAKRDTNLFKGKINGSEFNLFDEKYGIGKDGNDKGVAVSLISKYAYFETGYKFPIFDSIACEMYPRIWKYCGLKGKIPKLKAAPKDQQVQGAETILAFVNAIDELIACLGGGISYDHLDRLLWFTGKIYRGNLSLVIPRKDYEKCVKEKLIVEGVFDVTRVDISKLSFCQTNSRLRALFELAKTLKTNNC